MKITLSRTLVVEGKEDASYLSNYIASEIAIVNGFELSEKNISYLKNKSVILLLDPDEAGQQIKNKLLKLLNDCVVVNVDINKCSKGNKKGIAECEISEILTKLEPYKIPDVKISENIKISDIYNLGLTNNRELREAVCNKLCLGKCNNKLFFKRLNLNNIKLEKLRETVEEIRNGN